MFKQNNYSPNLRKLIAFSSVIWIVLPVFFILFLQADHRITSFLELIKSKTLYYSISSAILLTVDIVLPIPSSIVMYMNGLILGTTAGFLLSIVSATAAGFIGYYLGYKGFSNPNHEPYPSYFKKYDVLIILISRGIPMLSEIISVLSGYYKIKFKKFALYNLVGYIPICFVYSYLGQMDQEKEHFLHGFLISIVFSAGIWLLGKRIRLKP